MAIARERHSEHRDVYGWIAMPTAATGAASAFDFAALNRWWSRRRFNGGSQSDSIALMFDHLRSAADLRRGYYRALAERGITVDEEQRPIAYEQFTIFDRDEFRAR